MISPVLWRVAGPLIVVIRVAGLLLPPVIGLVCGVRGWKTKRPARSWRSTSPVVLGAGCWRLFYRLQRRNVSRSIEARIRKSVLWSLDVEGHDQRSSPAATFSQCQRVPDSITLRTCGNRYVLTSKPTSRTSQICFIPLSDTAPTYKSNTSPAPSETSGVPLANPARSGADPARPPAPHTHFDSSVTRSCARS